MPSACQGQGRKAVVMGNQNVTVKRAAELLGKSEMFVRIGLQRNLLPFGTAIKLTSKKYTYQIIKGALADYLHIDVSEVI